MAPKRKNEPWDYEVNWCTIRVPVTLRSRLIKLRDSGSWAPTIHEVVSRALSIVDAGGKGATYAKLGEKDQLEKELAGAREQLEIVRGQLAFAQGLGGKKKSAAARTADLFPKKRSARV